MRGIFFSTKAQSSQRMPFQKCLCELCAFVVHKKMCEDLPHSSFIRERNEVLS